MNPCDFCRFPMDGHSRGPGLTQWECTRCGYESWRSGFSLPDPERLRAEGWMLIQLAEDIEHGSVDLRHKLEDELGLR